MTGSAHKISFAQAVNEALYWEMKEDPKVVSIGLGHNDPKRIFGTTKGLLEEFGPDRAREMPISENALTGICVGLSLRGYKPVITHQRVDFALLSMDQIVNTAAKWRFMFNKKSGVPIVIRMIIGRGWGQGPTHSQSLQSWFAHVPGLKVMMPSGAKNAKGMLASAIQDPNPVIFLEHRWLHNVKEVVPKGRYFENLEQTILKSKGDDYTIVCSSLNVLEALKALKHLVKYNITLEVIDLPCLRPFNSEKIIQSVKKTGNLIVLENANTTGSFSSEIVATVAEKGGQYLKNSPIRLGSVDLPFPTGYELTKEIYCDANSIIKYINTHRNINIPLIEKTALPHDIPGDWFNGPF